MSASRIAARYSKSLLGLAIELNQLEEVLADIKALNNAISESREFELMLKSPIIHSSKKEEIIEAIFRGKLGEVTVNFIDILIRKRRENYLPDIVAAFVNQYNSHKEITPVKITTAIEIDAEVKDELLGAMKSKADLKNLEITSEVDADLIGGFVVQFDDKLYDASVSRRLRLMEKEFEQNTYIKKF